MGTCSPSGMHFILKKFEALSFQFAYVQSHLDGVMLAARCVLVPLRSAPRAGNSSTNFICSTLNRSVECIWRVIPGGKICFFGSRSRRWNTDRSHGVGGQILL